MAQFGRMEPDCADADPEPPAGRAHRSRVIALRVGIGIVALLGGFGIAIAIAPGGEQPDIAPAAVGPGDEPVAGIEQGGAIGPYDGDLRSLLFAPPTGVTTARGQGAADYTMSLAQAASVYGTSGAEYLTRLGFQQGASWTWAGPGYSVLILLYQFGSGADAFHWTADSVGAEVTDPATRAQGELPTIAGARYFVLAAPGGEWTTLVYLCRNDIGALIGVRSSGSPPDPQTATDVAERQYSRLP